MSSDGYGPTATPLRAPPLNAPGMRRMRLRPGSRGRALVDALHARCNGRWRLGVTAIETALIMPPFLLMCFGIIEVAMLYFVATALGAFTATRITVRVWSGWVVMAVMMAATVANFVMLPHPAWLMIAALVLIGAGGWLGIRTARPRPAAAG